MHSFHPSIDPAANPPRSVSRNTFDAEKLNPVCDSRVENREADFFLLRRPHRSSRFLFLDELDGFASRS